MAYYYHMPTDCPLCPDNHLLKTDILYQSENAYLIVAINFPGHYLIIPKTHVENIVDLPDGWWADFKQVFAHLPDAPSSYNLSLNYGRPAGQTAKHLHFWIVPRAEDTASAAKGLATLVREYGQGSAKD